MTHNGINTVNSGKKSSVVANSIIHHVMVVPKQLYTHHCQMLLKQYIHLVLCIRGAGIWWAALKIFVSVALEGLLLSIL